MTSDANIACADMILADAISDYSQRTGESEASVRTKIIETGAYDALYDESTRLWAMGPDAFIAFFERMVQAGR